MQCLGVIPARFESKRFPGKPLAIIENKPMIQWVYERSVKAASLDEVIVATDDSRILEVVKSFGGTGVMTSPEHQSGTDRIAEVTASYDVEFVVNIQGDEPLIEPKVIDEAVRPLVQHPEIEMGTIACPLSEDDLNDPNVVKVVFNAQNRALYFSRAGIPYVRHKGASETSGHDIHWQHIGLYVYRRDFLLRFTEYPVSRLERIEHLEQLRALEHGHTIYVNPTEYRSISVDTPGDLESVRRIFQTMD